VALSSPRFRGDERLQKAANNSPVMKKGEAGHAVRLLQQALMDLNYPLPKSNAKHGSPDGIYGGETRAQVRAFQKKHHLSVDGKTGKQTLGKLDLLLPFPAKLLPPLPDPAGPGGGNGSLSPAEQADLILTKDVLNAIAGPYTTYINFTLGGAFIHGSFLHKVGAAIHDERILVIYDPGISNLAEYRHWTDSLHVRFPRANTWRKRSIVIHEAVHAQMDMKSTPRPMHVSEGAAFVAQCIYYRKATGERLTAKPGTVADQVLEQADKLGQIYMPGKLPDKAEVDELYRLIKKLPGDYERLTMIQYDGLLT